MLKTSTKAGGGTEIGDVVSTHRSVLPDGKRLLPLSHQQVLDPLEYPEATSIIGQTLAVDRNYDIEPATNKSRILFNDPAAADTFIGLDFGNNISNFVTRNTPTSKTTLLSETRNTPSFAISDDGQEMYLAGDLSLTAPTTRGVRKSINSGASFTNTVLPKSNDSSNEAQWNEVVVQCNSTGTNVTVAALDYDSPRTVYFFESTDTGQSFTENATLTTLLSDSNAKVQNICISRDLATIFYLEVRLSSQFLPQLMRSVGGAAFVDIMANVTAAAKSDPRTCNAELSVSDDGSVVALLMVPTRSNGNVNQGSDIPEIVLSTDGGNTFKSYVLNIPIQDAHSNRPIAPMFNVSDDGKYIVVFAPVMNSSDDIVNINHTHLIRVSDMRVEPLRVPVDFTIDSTIVTEVFDSTYGKAVRANAVRLFSDNSNYYLAYLEYFFTNGAVNTLFRLKEDYWTPLVADKDLNAKLVVDPA